MLLIHTAITYLPTAEVEPQWSSAPARSDMCKVPDDDIGRSFNKPLFKTSRQQQSFNQHSHIETYI